MKHIIYFFTLLFFSLTAFGDELDQMPVPPSYEKTRSFTLLYVERQPNVPAFLKHQIKSLELKARGSWTAHDSLNYAFELVYLGEFTHALTYFSKVKTDTISHPVTLHLLQLTYLKTNRFDSLKKAIKRGGNSPSVKEIRLRLVEVREMYLNKTWDPETNIIFPLLRDSSNYLYKNSQKQFYKYLVPRAENYKSALLYDALYTDDTDKILSQAFEEFGDFLHKHFYLTNAFMSYSISRFYDKRNTSTAKKIKTIKTEMDEANLLQPSIRENFQKTSKTRYLFKEISEITDDSTSINATNSLTLEDIEALKAKKQPDYLPWINSELLLIVILGIMLFLVIVFIKSRK